MKITCYRTNNPKIIGGFIIFFSVLFITVGIIVSFVPKIKTKKCTEPVKAEVVDNILSNDKKGKYSKNFSPVFQFEYKGEKYTVISKASSNPPAFRIGERVELKIDPDNPNDFYAPSDKTFGMIGIIFLIMGGIFLFVGILMVILTARSNKNEEEINDENI